MKRKPRLSRLKMGVLSLLVAGGLSASKPLVETSKRIVNERVAQISTGVRTASDAVSTVFMMGSDRIKHGVEDLAKEIKREAACAVVDGISYGGNSMGIAAAGIATGALQVLVDTGIQIRDWSDDLAEWVGEGQCDPVAGGEIAIAACDIGMGRNF